MNIDNIARSVASRRSIVAGALASISAVSIGGGIANAQGRGRVEAATNTTLGIKVKPRIFNARTADQAAAICGPGTETELPDRQVAVAKLSNKGGVDGGPGYAIGKKAPTASCAAGVFDLPGSEGIVLNRLGFDVSGYCGGGAPRFNVSFVDGTSEFFGCTSPNMETVETFTDKNGREWTRKRAILGVHAGKEVESMGMVSDEQGTSRLDNIAISNATLKGVAPKKTKRKNRTK